MPFNKDAPKGFLPVRHLNGSAWNGLTQQFLVDSGDATAIYIGDPVKFAGSSGAAGQIVNGVNCEGMATVARDTSGTTGQAFAGVVIGFLPDPLALQKSYRVASTSRIALVVTDLSVVYEVQEDADTTPIAAASVGLACAITTTAGSTVTGVSAMVLDSSTVATTSTLPVKIIGLVPRPDNALSTGTTDKAKFEVVFNTGWFAPNSVGA